MSVQSSPGPLQYCMMCYTVSQNSGTVEQILKSKAALDAAAAVVAAADVWGCCVGDFGPPQGLWCP